MPYSKVIQVQSTSTDLWRPILVLPLNESLRDECSETRSLPTIYSRPTTQAFAKVIHKLKYRKTELKFVVPGMPVVQLPATPSFQSVVSMEGTLRSESVNVFTAQRNRPNMFDKSAKAKRPSTEDRILGYNLDKMIKVANSNPNNDESLVFSNADTPGRFGTIGATMNNANNKTKSL